MRPNYAQDAPPTEIKVGGFSYTCKTDYRVWLEVLQLFSELDYEDTTEAGAIRLNAQFERMQELVFGGVLVDENPVEVLKAINDFSKGYPTAPSRSRMQAPTFSFDYDLNEIILAIRNQSGIDLSYRRTEPFHWWEFLLEFRTLCGDHYILNLMELRGYKGKDPELKRRSQDVALPEQMSAAERREYSDFSAMFEEVDSDDD